MLANGKQNKKTVSDIISISDLESWTPKNIIIISAGTGRGKSYFIKNHLYEYAKSAGKKILFLIHRTNCVTQFMEEIKRDGKTDVIDIKTYQNIESGLINHGNHIDYNKYSYIVSDEFHYFVSDANFNNTTDVSFSEILKADKCIKIFMSATGQDVEQYFKQHLSKRKHSIRKYELPPDYSYVKDLTFFSQDDDMAFLAEKTIKTNEKAIIFIQSAEKAYKLYKKFSQYSLFNCSQNNKTYYEHVNRDKIHNMLKNECFEENLLITTSCFDAGANILDTSVTKIVADIKDLGSLIQCLGRKRCTGSDDTVEFYIKTINNQQLSGMKRSMSEEIKMAEFLLSHSTQELIKAYPRQYDKSRIIYDVTKSNYQKNMATKNVNMMMLSKKKSDIKLFAQLMQESYGYCKYLARYLGFYDYDTGNYMYHTFSKDHSREAFLEECVLENKVMLQLRDRKPLIEKLNIRDNGHLVKGFEAINKVLEESNMPYKIKQFKTSRKIVNAQGNTVKKNYKSAWKIERVS